MLVAVRLKFEGPRNRFEGLGFSCFHPKINHLFLCADHKISMLLPEGVGSASAQATDSLDRQELGSAKLQPIRRAVLAAASPVGFGIAGPCRTAGWVSRPSFDGFSLFRQDACNAHPPCGRVGQPTELRCRRTDRRLHPQRVSPHRRSLRNVVASTGQARRFRRIGQS